MVSHTWRVPLSVCVRVQFRVHVPGLPASDRRNDMYSIVCGEDDPYIQKLLNELLERRGYAVRSCVTGQEVVDAVTSKPPDLILLDVMMPVMSGMAVLQELRPQLHKGTIPVIVISGISDEETIASALTAGATDYIVKPFTPSEVMAKVDMALSRRQAQLKPRLELRPGERFYNHYQIVSLQRTGGVSSLYQALDLRITTPDKVALKVFDFDTARQADRKYMATFLREAYGLARLDHPCIVKFREFGQSGLHYFMAM